MDRLKKLCILLLMALPAFARDLSYDEKVVSSGIEQKIQALLKDYDPKALVLVELKFKRVESSMPSTPFVVDNLTISADDGNPQVEKVKIKIYSERPAPWPVSINTLILDLAKTYGVKPELEVLALPKELADRLPSVDEVKAPEPAPRSWLPETLGAILVALFALNGLWGRQQNKKLYLRFEQALRETMESGLGGASAQVSSTAPRESLRAEFASVETRDSIELFEEGLQALFMDCYWNELDAYAAFVWRKISLEQRQKLLARDSLLREYAGLFSETPPQDLGYESDPAYFSPLPISHLDQRSLTEWVRANPGALPRLSRIRGERLLLSASERIQLEASMTASAPSDAKWPDLEDRTPSASRQIKRKLRLVLKSFEEERELLAKEQLSASVKSSIPSLGWLLKAPKADAERILKEFHARDLASAWIGPEEILSELEALLPERKRKLLKEYLISVRPDRNAPTFVALHARALEVLPREEAA